METLLPLLVFVLVQSCSPGPNNIMVLSSGANFGLARTWPHIIGIAIGFPVMIVAAGLGLGAALEAWPPLHTILKWIAFLYLLVLAWQILRSKKPDTGKAGARPLTVWQAALFQWVNPKGWAAMLGAIALFTTEGGNKVLEIGLIAFLFGAVCLPNGATWALFGSAIARFLQDDTRRFWFNATMAVLLIVSVVPTLFW